MMAKSPLSSGRIIKVKKADPPKSDCSLPATEPVFNFVHYLVWFGNHPKPKSGFSQWILYTFLDFQDFDSQHTIFSSHIEKTRVPGH